MSEVIFTLGVLVWLGAAYAFVRLVMSWVAIARAAPAGQAWKAMVQLGFLNFPEVRRTVGDKAEPHIARYGRSVALFASCTAGLIGLVIVNIATGNAA